MIKGTEFQGELEVGTRVHCILYGGRDGIVFKITGDQHPENIRHLGGGCVVTGGSATFDIVFEDGTISYAVPEGIVRGVQWSIQKDNKANEGEIEFALAYAELEKRRKEQEKEEKDKAKEECRQAFLRAHPELEPVDPEKYDSRQKGSKNLKQELKDLFPETKFSVRCSSFAGGNSIDVSWTDGPTTDQVEKISGKYQEGHFNGMEDIYEYSDTNVWPSVFGGAKYVQTHRHDSKEAYLKAVAEVEEEYGIKLKVSYTESGSPYISNDDDVNIYEREPHLQYASRCVNRKLSETSHEKMRTQY